METKTVIIALLLFIAAFAALVIISTLIADAAQVYGSVYVRNLTGQNITTPYIIGWDNNTYAALNMSYNVTFYMNVCSNGTSLIPINQSVLYNEKYNLTYNFSSSDIVLSYGCGIQLLNFTNSSVSYYFYKVVLTSTTSIATTSTTSSIINTTSTTTIMQLPFYHGLIDIFRSWNVGFKHIKHSK